MENSNGNPEGKDLQKGRLQARNENSRLPDHCVKLWEVMGRLRRLSDSYKANQVSGKQDN